MPKEYRTIEEVAGPIMLVRGVQGITYDGIGKIEPADGERRRYRILEIDGDNAMIQLYETTTSTNPDSSKARLLGRTMGLGVSEDMLSRTFDGMGKSIDGGPDTLSEERMDIDSLSTSPTVRSYPEEFIQTGVSVIDGLNILVRGQKLPIFSASGLPHVNLAAQIARQVKIYGTDKPFAAVFAAIGITFEETNFSMENFRETDAIDRSIMFINLANGPAVERIATPCIALTAAEYLTPEKNIHVLVILIDATNYADSFHEISVARKEVPERHGYPRHMYTDLASLYEGAGHQGGKTGSITIISIPTMPEDGKTHPIPDLTGYITKGQIILSHKLYRKNVTPPVDMLPPLSCLEDEGIGKGKTKANHANIVNQLFAAYARGKNAKELMVIPDEAVLTDMDKLYAKLADEPEKEYVPQGYCADHEIEETVKIGWKLLCILPRSRLKRIKNKFLDLYYGAK